MPGDLLSSLPTPGESESIPLASAEKPKVRRIANDRLLFGFFRAWTSYQPEA